MPARTPARTSPRRLAAAVLASGAILLAWAPVAAEAAQGGLVVLARTQYVVEPDLHRVHVTVDAVATSFEPDSGSGQTYYTGSVTK